VVEWPYRRKHTYQAYSGGFAGHGRDAHFMLVPSADEADGSTAVHSSEGGMHPLVACQVNVVAIFPHTVWSMLPPGVG